MVSVVNNQSSVSFKGLTISEDDQTQKVIQDVLKFKGTEKKFNWHVQDINDLCTKIKDKTGQEPNIIIRAKDFLRKKIDYDNYFVPASIKAYINDNNTAISSLDFFKKPGMKQRNAAIMSFLEPIELHLRTLLNKL